VPDLIFDHPRLAAIYDAFDGGRDDLDAYLGIVDELGARFVLDVGCGTGCLAVLLAAGGSAAGLGAGAARRVVGVDPSAASLDVARGKDGAAEVTWLLGDATALPALDADLALMTGNVAQVFLADDDWTRTLRAIGSALRPGGHLVFETRRPDHRAWLEWAADTAPEVRTIPGIGEVERRLVVTAVDLPFVSFRYTYRFASDGEVLTSDSTLRFRSRAELEESLADNGFRVSQVREAPDRPGREYVFIAERCPV
jgi:SAM-dependent methyltransferase